MAEVIRMPRMSDTMTEGVIVAWHKKVGDKVKSGDLMAEIETDKAVMEFESFQDGVLLYIGAEKGAAVPVDSVIAVLGKEGEDYKAALAVAGSAPVADKPVEAPKTETTKAETAVAPTVTVPVVTPVTAPSKETVAAVTPSNGRIKASPLAKKIAADSGVNISQVLGSGDDGRIIKKDIEAYLSSGKSKGAQPFVNGKESFEDVPLSQMRKTIARRLTESKFSAPHFYLKMDIVMDKSMDVRKQMNDYLGEKISINDFVIKASAMALRENPNVNSSFLGDKIRYNHHIHIGMAVAVEEGLLVPVIKFADQKSFSQISAEAKAFGARAKEKKLQPVDWEGNTFTISNLGMMDIDDFTAIINPPDACILAVGKIKTIPAFDEKGNVKPTNVMTVTLSCDHRVVDGAKGAKFLQSLKKFLENPVTMLV
ncbi:dihydrolipoamide acetyltransferase component of pyruvate dehydrogenase complex [Bacteroidota bacterium]|nr:dihydrolipoamide acetyltransferase component of pyruvate dehydrogenase complex [Bacteroidota bacterium]